MAEKAKVTGASNAGVQEQTTAGAPQGGKDASELVKHVEAAVATEDAAGDVAGSFSIAMLSQETRDAMMKEFRDLAAQVDQGFGELTAPGKIAALDQPFKVVDAFTIDDYEDRVTGEVKVKHVFRLEFNDGVIRNVMQSDARPRRVLARLFTVARQMGGRLEAGPYKYVTKDVKQLQPAWIFEQQPGFAQRAYA